MPAHILDNKYLIVLNLIIIQLLTISVCFVRTRLIENILPTLTFWTNEYNFFTTANGYIYSYTRRSLELLQYRCDTLCHSL